MNTEDVASTCGTYLGSEKQLNDNHKLNQIILQPVECLNYSLNKKYMRNHNHFTLILKMKF